MLTTAEIAESSRTQTYDKSEKWKADLDICFCGTIYSNGGKIQSRNKTMEFNKKVFYEFSMEKFDFSNIFSVWFAWEVFKEDTLAAHKSDTRQSKCNICKKILRCFFFFQVSQKIWSICLVIMKLTEWRLNVDGITHA